MATKSVVQLTRQRAVKLLQFAGFHGAPEWDNEKLEVKLGKLNEVYQPSKDGQSEDTEINEDVAMVMLGIESGDGFEVVGDKDAKEEFFGGTSTEKAAKPKKERKPKKEKAEKKPREAKKETRGYFAGRVVRKHGYENGITEQMIKEVDELYGTPNPDVSKGALNWAISGIRGWFDAEKDKT